ncbi:MAG: vitamin K epoxide reductase family protein [Anaerolineae bacterium]|nr:vitamin K epoxide reductase family protein [Anaerolineae bacterium]
MYLHLFQAAAPASEVTSQGFEIATVVLIGMAVALVYAFVAMIRGAQGHPPRRLPTWVDYLIPAICAIGMVVASYLAYIEITSTVAVCGPVGDCNAVNTSTYARLFGILPIGLMGVGGYISILLAWLWGRFRSDRLSQSMPAILFGLTLFGTLFSIYLTYLEIYVIRAVCMWCLSSAVFMAVLLLLSVNPVLLKMEPDENRDESRPRKAAPDTRAEKRRTPKRKKRK